MKSAVSFDSWVPELTKDEEEASGKSKLQTKQKLTSAAQPSEKRKPCELPKADPSRLCRTETLRYAVQTVV